MDQTREPRAPLAPFTPVIVRLRLIGQMEAWTIASESILPTGRKTRALLAIVALSAPRPVLRGRLAELLWSRRPEEQARASLRQEIHRLLDALDPVGNQILTITRDHLALRSGVVWVDVDEVERASAAKPAGLGLFDGDLLEDLDGVDPAFDGWLSGERERLRDRARLLAEALLGDQNEPEPMILAAQQLLKIDRTHEGAWRALMRAYAARGEHGMALQAFERCRAVLAEQLDAPPSAETQRLALELRSTGGNQAASQTGIEPPASELPPPAALRPPPRVPRSPQRGLEEEVEPLSGMPERLESRPQSPVRHEASRAVPPRGGARVGVLPLQLAGTTPAEAHLATGLADEITTALARFRWMFLINSSSLARYAAQTRDEGAIRRTFGLDFLLDGTIQRGGERLRVTLRLLDLRADNQVVWSGRFERDATDLLTLQDEVAAQVVAQIDPEILLIESQRASTRPLADPNAYDLVLRSLPLINRLERPLFMEAGEMLARATELEPDYAAAHAWYAYWHVFLVGQAWAGDPQAGMLAAGRLADRAITLDPQDARAFTIAGHVRALMHHRLREALTLHERGLTLNPNLAMAWNLSGATFAYMGDLDEAARRLARYKQLSPLDPQAFFFDTTAMFVALLKHDHERAAEIGREVTAMNPAFSAACKPFLAALGHIGDLDEAATVRERLATLEPGFSVTRFLAATPIERPEHREHFAEGLRLAGIPE